MAKTIPQLTDATTVNAADELIIQQGGITKRATGAELAKGLNAINGTVNVKDFGAVGDGAADDTAAIQAAINAAQAGVVSVYLPAGRYRLASPLTITTSVNMRGEGAEFNYVTTTYRGTWFHFDHAGVGISVTTTGHDGVTLQSFGTVRNQPAPTSGWAPNSNDWDILINGTDVSLNNLMLLNPTKAIQMASIGRLNINHLRGQPFQKGIEIERALDVCQINNIHFWPFWKDDGNLHTYTRANLIALNLFRCDNPKVINFFSIFAKHGIRLGSNIHGFTSRALFSNAGIDQSGQSGIYVDGDNSSAQFCNGYTLGDNSINKHGIECPADGCFLDFTNIRITNSLESAVKVTGSSNTITLSQVRVELWNLSNASHVAFSAPVGGSSKILIADQPQLSNGNGAAVANDPVEARSDTWIGYTPTITSTIGAITSYTASGTYKIVGTTVHFRTVITITNAGTGAGVLRVTAPTPVGTFIPEIFSVCGRETLINGNSLAGEVVWTSGNSRIEILKYDTTTAIATGAVLRVAGFYNI
jgi:hypothetical protein